MSAILKQDRKIGNNLRYFRLKYGFTQEQIAIKLQLQGIDVSRSMYSQMEGGTYNIRISILDVLVELYHVDYNALLMPMTYHGNVKPVSR